MSCGRDWLTCVRDGVDLLLLALQLAVVVVGIALRGEVPDRRQQQHGELPHMSLRSIDCHGIRFAAFPLVRGPCACRPGTLNGIVTDGIWKAREDHLMLMMQVMG